ncbi:unnamed protein product [Symbiodinium sp. KB8]|nr:unnamed protein product [Symbiodinium sp. KB8]
MVASWDTAWDDLDLGEADWMDDAVQKGYRYRQRSRSPSRAPPRLTEAEEAARRAEQIQEFRRKVESERRARMVEKYLSRATVPAAWWHQEHLVIRYSDSLWDAWLKTRAVLAQSPKFVVGLARTLDLAWTVVQEFDMSSKAADVGQAAPALINTFRELEIPWSFPGIVSEVMETCIPSSLRDQLLDLTVITVTGPCLSLAGRVKAAADADLAEQMPKKLCAVDSFPPTAAGKNHIVSYMEELKRMYEAYSGKALVDGSGHVVTKSAFKDPAWENLKKRKPGYFSTVLKTAKVGGKAEKLNNDSFSNAVWSKFAWVKPCSKEGCKMFLGWLKEIDATAQLLLTTS